MPPLVRLCQSETQESSWLHAPFTSHTLLPSQPVLYTTFYRALGYPVSPLLLVPRESASRLHCWGSQVTGGSTFVFVPSILLFRVQSNLLDTGIQGSPSLLNIPQWLLIALGKVKSFEHCPKVLHGPSAFQYLICIVLPPMVGPQYLQFPQYTLQTLANEKCSLPCQ